MARKCPYRPMVNSMTSNPNAMNVESVSNDTVYFSDCYEHDCPYYQEQDTFTKSFCERVNIEKANPEVAVSSCVCKPHVSQ